MNNRLEKVITKLSTEKYKRLFLNFFHYGFFQFVRRIVPFIVVPYLMRTIGSEKFGIISLARAICYYIRITVRYGFSITGVQMVAKAKDDSKKESEIFSNVIFIQSLLAIVGFLVYIIIVLSFKELRKNFLVYLFSYGLVIANIFIALWFYIGRERMEYINFINFLSKVSYLILIVLLVNEESDFYLVPFFRSVTMLVGSIVSLYLLYKKFGVRFVIPKISKLKKYLIEGWPIFISHLSINLYRSLNVVILGAVGSNSAVGLYSAGEKIIKGLQGILRPITNTLYPRISKVSKKDSKKGVKAVKYLIFIMGILCSGIIIGLWVMSKPITVYVRGEYSASVFKIIRIGSFVILFGVINYIVGIIFMTNYNLKKQFRNSVLFTGILNIIICTVLSYYFKEIGTIISLVTSEIILFITMSLYIYKNKSKWRFNISE